MPDILLTSEAGLEAPAVLPIAAQDTRPDTQTANAAETGPRSAVETEIAAHPKIGEEQNEEQSKEQNSAAQQADTQAVNAFLTATQHKIRRRKLRFWSAFAVCEGALMLVLFPLCLLGIINKASLLIIGAAYWSRCAR